MTTTRRDFLKDSVGATAIGGLGLFPRTATRAGAGAAPTGPVDLYHDVGNRRVEACCVTRADEGAVRREEWNRVEHSHGVPCFNDAAADVTPISKLWNSTKMGFDLVCFSAGKGIHGPQNAGLLLGRKD